MITWSLLSLFVPTFFLVSLTPGLCMTLALSLGMTLGVRRTLWMMAGELVGVGLVAVATVVGVAAVLVRYPAVFMLCKWLGGAYLIYLGAMMWRARGNLALPEAAAAGTPPPAAQLISQGFITAIANPKGWAFFIALLPPFLDFDRPVAPQLAALVAIMLTLELTCLLLYASGGSAARRFLGKRHNVRRLNRVAGTLIMAVGLWLALD